MTPEQKRIARHMLGLPNERKRSYRNRFCASEGHSDYEILLAMQENGYLKVRVTDWHAGNLWFLTLRAAELALEIGETLDMEDFPKGLR